jgi:hypothetical protein
MDIGERVLGAPVFTYKNFPITAGKTVAEVFSEFKIDDTFHEGVPVSSEFIERAVKLALSVGFLAKCDNFPFDADVLAKDRPKYRQGDPGQRDRCVARAHRQGKHGWFVGTDDTFRRAAIRSDREGTGRELDHAHIRGCHFNFYWCGPRDSPTLEARWIPAQTVRPDLPFKPH